ncbi:MAG: arylesterase [Vicinamibacterales bacterium]
MSARAIPASVGVWLLAGVLGCGSVPAAPERATATAAAAPAAHEPAAEAEGIDPARRIVFLGDSLTAGLGLPADESYPSLIQRRLEARGGGWTVVNAGVSGDTSAGGVRRLDWSIDGGAAVVVIALGGNDGLRGLPVSELSANLETLITRSLASGARVILAGMEAPPNYGPEYTAGFRRIYPTLAARHGVTLVPFLLDGVAGIDSLNQGDGIHPNREGARRVADTVWKALDPILGEIEAESAR